MATVYSTNTAPLVKDTWTQLAADAQFVQTNITQDIEYWVSSTGSPGVNDPGIPFPYNFEPFSFSSEVDASVYVKLKQKDASVTIIKYFTDAG